VQFHQKYYTKCILRIYKKCKNRSLIEGFAPFLESTSTPLLHGRQQKKSKGRGKGQIFFLGPIWQNLKDSAAGGLMTSPTAAEGKEICPIA